MPIATSKHNIVTIEPTRPTKQTEEVLGSLKAVPLDSFWRRRTLQFENQMTERRKSGRFAIERDIRYRVLNKKSNQAGQGKTLNISSAGILFTTEHVLLPGRTLEISVNWPAQLNDTCPLKLVARGRVVRFEPGKAAIEIQHYEFRTQGTAMAATAAGPVS